MADKAAGVFEGYLRKKLSLRSTDRLASAAAAPPIEVVVHVDAAARVGAVDGVQPLGGY